MKTLSKIMWLIAIMVLPLITACHDDDTTTPDQPKEEANDTIQIVPLTFDRFLTENDVIVAVDTSYITVSKHYLQSIGKELHKNDRIVVWNSNKVLPFARKVYEVSEMSNNRLKIDLEYCDYREILPGGRYMLSTDIYRDPKATKRTNDGGINEDYYTEEVSGDSVVYHPVAVFVDSPNTNNDVPDYDYENVMPCTMIEDLDKYNFDWKITLLSLDINLDNVYYNFVGDSTSATHLSVGCPSKLEANLGVRLTLDGIWESEKLAGSWNWSYYYVNDFYVGLKGDAKLTLSPQFTFRGKYTQAEDKKWEWELGEFPKLSFVFFLGPIPVTVTSTPKLMYSITPVVQGSLSAGVDIEASADFNIGYRWRRGYNGQSIDSAGTAFKCTPRLKATGKVGIQTGLYLCSDVLLFDVAGFEMSIGPGAEVTTSGGFTWSPSGTTGSGKFSIDASVGGEAKAKVTFFGHNFGSLSWGYTLWSMNLFKYSF